MNSSTSISERCGAVRAPRRSSARTGCAYLARLGVLTAVLVGLGGLLVWSVDPYGALGRNRLGLYAESERQAKPAMLRAAGARAVLIGSSKTAYVDPAPLGPGAFNASFSAAMPEEIVNFLRRDVAPGATVVIGLDTFMMNVNAFPMSPGTFREPSGSRDTLAYVFGLRPAMAAARAVALRAGGRRPVLRANGQRDPTDRLARHTAMTRRDDGRWLDHLRTHHFANFEYSAARVAALRDILDVARSRRLTLYVFVNPLSRPVRGLLEHLPARDDVARFRADVREILPGVVDLSLAPGWEDPDRYFRFDPFHYLPETGRQILRTVLARPPVYRPADAAAPFGVVRGDSYSAAPRSLTLKRRIEKRAAFGGRQDSTREAVP